jgi:hypothetical protein
MPMNIVKSPRQSLMAKVDNLEGQWKYSVVLLVTTAMLLTILLVPRVFISSDLKDGLTVLDCIYQAMVFGGAVTLRTWWKSTH